MSTGVAENSLPKTYTRPTIKNQIYAQQKRATSTDNLSSHNQVESNWMKIRSLKKLIAGFLFLFIFFMGVKTAWAYNTLDRFGYNYDDRTFNGIADGVDNILDNAVFRNKTHARDYLTMTWTKSWDDAQFNSADWTCKASMNYKWNGESENGSGKTRYYKIIWVGDKLENSPCWINGGYSIWMEFEVVPYKGTTPRDLILETHVNPNSEE